MAGTAWLRRLLAGLTLLCAMGAQATPPTVDFGAGDAEVLLGRAAQVLADPADRLTLAQLRRGVPGWRDAQSDTFNFGFDRATWWVHMRLHNTQARDVQRVLDLGSALQDEIDVYLVREVGDAGESVEHLATGDRRPFADRPIQTRVPSVPIHFAAGEQLDVYVRLATHDGLHEAVALKLWEPRAYARHSQAENLFFGLYYGALITVLAYNLFLFLATRQRTFGLYAAYVSAFLLWSFTFRGYAFQYLWPDAPVFNNQLLPIAAAACYCTFAVFTVAYLDTRRKLPPWLHRLIVNSAIGNALCVTPALFGHYALAFAASIPFGVTLMVSAGFGSALMLRQGSRPARYFSLSFSLLALGVMLYYLLLLGAVPSNVFTENFLQIGSAAEVLLLAFGLADQMNQLRAGKLRAEREALAAQTALANELEGLVQRRTRALEAANRRLQELSTNDALTGAYNARHFVTVLDAELARHSRSAAPVALCLFDLDRFGRYNAEHGHLAGDLALQRVAQTVRQRLRRGGDQLFRLHDDQFALVMNLDPQAGGTLDFVESLRADIEAIDWVPGAQRAAGGPVLTASFGVIVLTSSAPALSANDVINAASHMLDQARQQGGNLVSGRIWAGPTDRSGLRLVGAQPER